MNRTIRIQIDRSSWPKAPQLPRFPRSFMGIGVETMNVPAVLLKIGFLTTPSTSSGVSLSEFWAYVRYLAAITGDSDLRLTTAFANLDAHQKTILSDDFGMGVPMTWLTHALDLQQICDGRYFLDRFAAQAGATVQKTARRGPNKVPDFVARDGRRIWHVVECKGTQSGSGYQEDQIGSAGPPPTGGIAQKRAIVFPRNYSGQRLVCALSIGLEGTSGSSTLKIVDPEPEDPVVVEAADLDLAEDAVQRGSIAKALRLAGFEATADVTAAPLGRFASSKRDPRRRFEEERLRVVEERRAVAQEELSREDGIRWRGRGASFRGRELSIVLPRPLIIDGSEIQKVLLRQGINEEVLSELRERPVVDSPLPTADVSWDDAGGSTTIDTSDGFAALQIGELFRSEMQFG
ncbi:MULTISPECIES: hypothetical protein [Aurantimonas]|uniref:hypothetical protein n=1 Tax=Aurantimonas TaxID=182269 RepID=UPI0035178836